jgi:sulfoxide reductase heme-binding subunit YedZ
MAGIPALPRRLHGPSIWALYAVGLVPAAWNFYLGATGGLGVNPVKTFPLASTSRSTNSITASGALSPKRKPAFMMRR